MTSQLEISTKLITQIEELYPLVNRIRKQIISKQQWINRNRTLITKSKFSKRFLSSYPNLCALTLPSFDIKQFWLENLLEFYTTQVKYLTEINDDIQKFYDSIIMLSHLYDDEIPEMIGKSYTKILSRCSECYKIFGCKEHEHSEQHHKLWCKEIKNDKVQNLVAIDTEFVHTDSIDPTTRKHRLIPFRVAACMNFLVGKKIIPTLVYHSFWNPGTDFRVYTPIVGLTKMDFFKNENQFIDPKKGKQKRIEDVIKDRILIFAGSQQDLLAIDIKLNNEIRDIQDFYCRDPYNKHKQPMKLSWLARHIFFNNIQELNENNPIHNPVIDALFTLRLYNKIPAGFWNRNVDSSINSNKTIKNAVIKNFHDDFEPDWEC